MKNYTNPSQASAVLDASRLEEGIYTDDPIKISESIKNLIKRGARLRITYLNNLLSCATHQNYFPNQMEKFPASSLITSYFCQYNHSVCYNCAEIYIKSFFPYNSIANVYQCPGCLLLGAQDSLIFDDNNLSIVLNNLHNKMMINLNLASIHTIPKIDNTKSTTCQMCLKDFKTFTLCNNGHLVCSMCIRNLLNTSNTLECPIGQCKVIINEIVKACENTDLVFNNKQKFWNFGKSFNFCFSCKNVIVPDTSKMFTICSCGRKTCNNCGNHEHFGKTCCYFAINEDFAIIDLKPPVNRELVSNLFEQEYLNAKYAFNQFINPAEGVTFKTARLIVNKKLEDAYSVKKNQMAADCGGQDKVNEIYVWHGSKLEFYDPIMKEGFKISKVDPGIQQVNGDVHGLGVYSARTPNTPKLYANNSKWVLCCLALAGNDSGAPIKDKDLLDNGKTHSYNPKEDWMVFFTKEQILPRFLVEYKELD